MKNKLHITLCAIFIIALFHSCKKDTSPLEEIQPLEETPITTRAYSQFDVAADYSNAQNFLMRTYNHALTVALLSPLMHGLQGDPYVDTRSCPTITGPFPNTTTGSLDIIIDFGTDCYFTNTIGGSADTISGIVVLKKFGGPITDTATNIFLEIDELKFNHQLIRFVPGSISGTDRIKFKFFTGTGGTFNYNAFIDGAFGTSAFDRSHFEIINCQTQDSLLLYPTYSGQTAFNFEYIDPHGSDPVFNYDSLVHACYNVNISPMKAFYYDGAADTLKSDYNIRKLGDPLLYKPLCKWIFGGDVIYENIENDPNFTDMDPDDPVLELFYGSDEFGNISANQCDRFIKMTSCTEYLNGACIMGADTTIIECSL